MTIDWNVLKRQTIIFFGFMIVGFLAMVLIQPDVRTFLNDASSAIKMTTSNDPLQKFLQYVLHNGIDVPIKMFILALIPIPGLYLMSTMATAVSVGVMLYLPFMSGVDGRVSLLQILVGILPHGIFEWAGFLIWAASLYFLNRKIKNVVYKRQLKITDTLKSILVNNLKTYFYVALPLLIFAAAIEAFVTPAISNVFFH